MRSMAAWTACAVLAVAMHPASAGPVATGPLKTFETRSCITLLRGPEYAGTVVKNLCNTFVNVRYCYEPYNAHRCDLNGGVWDSRELGPKASVRLAYTDALNYYAIACEAPARPRTVRGKRGQPTEYFCEAGKPFQPRQPRPPLVPSSSPRPTER